MKFLHLASAFIAFLIASTGFAESAFESAVRTSLLKSFDDASGKLLRLAEAIPEDTYAWRPMDGVASVREVMVHVDGTNYSLAERLGTKSGVDRKALGDSMRSKADALSVAKRSMDLIREVLTKIPAEDLIPEVNVFGAKAPKMRVALLPVDHAHEHLGQLIAYARMNRIVPPWSK